MKNRFYKDYPKLSDDLLGSIELHAQFKNVVDGRWASEGHDIILEVEEDFVTAEQLNSLATFFKVGGVDVTAFSEDTGVFVIEIINQDIYRMGESFNPYAFCPQCER